MSGRAALLALLVFAAPLGAADLFETGRPSKQAFANWAYGYGALTPDLRHVSVYVSIAESRRLRRGAPAEVRLGENVEGTTPVNGEIVDILADADPRTGQAIVTISIPAQTAAARTYATARFELDSRIALAVPTTAVVFEDGHPTVYKKKSAEDYEPAVVQIGQQTADFTEILGGVSPGDVILVQGALEWANRAAAAAEAEDAE